MARPDFALTWGSDNAPFTAIEASDYTAGWVFRTGAPPRRVNFDYYQNLADQRANWLGEQMLLAVGHEWQDDVSYDAYAITRSPVDGQLYRSLVGGNLGNEPSVSGAQWALGVADSTDTLNAPIATVAAAATIDLTTGAPDTSQLVISGTGVSINGFTVAADRFFVVKMTGASNTLVNSASLVTGRGANIPVVAGDSFLMRSTAADTVEILGFVENPVPRASLTANGWQRLPSGLIFQWGTTGSISSNATQDITFPIAFPNGILNVNPSIRTDAVNSAAGSYTYSITASGFTLRHVSVTGIAASYYWFAIGY